MRTRTTTRVWKKMTAALLTLAMVLWVLAPSVALADDDKTIACVGTNGITVPSGGWTKEAGSYVYYGKYDGNNPTKYRVLANGTSDFGGTTMLLDCDAVLHSMPYDDTDPKSNAWSGSDLQVWIQGTNFLTKENNFSSQEAAAIAKSTKAEGTNTMGEKDHALLNEQVFILSAGEAVSYYASEDARAKRYGDVSCDWWLRSTITYSFQVPRAAVVNDIGHLVDVSSAARTVDTYNVGVCPAFNINLSSVIFSSVVKEAVDGASGPEYKLTIKDEGLIVEPGDATISGTTATIPYVISGNSVNQNTQSSYVVLRNTWGSNENEILAYGKLGLIGEEDGTFVLPDGCTADGWGDTYHVYVLAENVNGAQKTDYASAPSEVTLIKPATADPLAITGSGHLQKLGDRAARKTEKGIIVGTTGEAKRLEALAVSLPDGTDGKISYRAHVQGKGWTDWVEGGSACGTIGEARRLEAVQMTLSDDLAGSYSVWYRVHSQTFGWLGWAHDGQAAGTAGQAKRGEAVEVQVLPADEKPEGYDATRASYVGAATADAHLQRVGWTGARLATAFGTTGEARRLEAVRISLDNQPASGGISYDVHLQRKGWVDGFSDGALAGTTGEAKRLEAVRVRLTGDMAPKQDGTGYSVWYRVHSQTYGWLGWAHDGQEAGTTGLAKRAEAIDVQILPQGQLPNGYDAVKPACVTR